MFLFDLEVLRFVPIPLLLRRLGARLRYLWYKYICHCYTSLEDLDGPRTGLGKALGQKGNRHLCYSFPWNWEPKNRSWLLVSSASH